MIGSRRQRRRRRHLGRYLGALVITLVVLLIFFAVRSARPSATEERQAELTYLDLARPVILQSNQDASTVTDVRQRPAQLGLVELQRRLDQLVSDTARAYQEASSLDPPPALAAAAQHLRACLKVRRQAAVELREGMILAVGNGAEADAVTSLGEAGHHLVSADSSCAAFVRRIPRATRRQARMPQSRWVTTPSVWRATTLSDFVAAVRGSSSLQADHDLVLALVSLQPTPIQSSQGREVLLPTGTISVTALVINVGNQKEHGVPVVATITPQSGSSTTTHAIIAINPNQHEAVTLPPLRVSSGTNYTLSVSVGPVPGEVRTEDNHLDIAVQVGS